MTNVLLFALGFIEFFVFIRAMRELYLETILEDARHSVDAEVVKTETQSIAFRPGWYVYYVTCRFEIPNGHYQMQQRISKVNYMRLYRGNIIPVAYVPNNPKISRLSGKYTDNTQRNMALRGLFVTTIIVILLSYIVIVGR